MLTLLQPSYDDQFQLTILIEIIVSLYSTQSLRSAGVTQLLDSLRAGRAALNSRHCSKMIIEVLNLEFNEL
jgi:hypothetical protein